MRCSAALHRLDVLPRRPAAASPPRTATCCSCSRTDSTTFCPSRAGCSTPPCGRRSAPAKRGKGRSAHWRFSLALRGRLPFVPARHPLQLASRRRRVRGQARRPLRERHQARPSHQGLGTHPATAASSRIDSLAFAAPLFVYVTRIAGHKRASNMTSSSNPLLLRAPPSKTTITRSSDRSSPTTAPDSSNGVLPGAAHADRRSAFHPP